MCLHAAGFLSKSSTHPSNYKNDVWNFTWQHLTGWLHTDYLLADPICVQGVGEKCVDSCAFLPNRKIFLYLIIFGSNG